MHTALTTESTSQSENVIELVRIAQRFPCGSAEYIRAIETLVTSVRRKIEHFAYSFDKECEMEDIVQDVSLKIFERLHQLQDPAFFSTWIYRVTANECLDKRRKRRARPLFLIDDLPSSSHKPEATGGEREDTIENAPGLDDGWENRVILGMYFVRLFEVLTEEEKLMVELHHLEGLSSEVMSELMDMNENTFKIKMYRIRQRLAARMEQLERPPLTAKNRK